MKTFEEEKIRVKIPQNICEAMPEISYYNHQYFRMPIEINGCNIFLIDYGGSDEYWHGGCIGVLVDGKFDPRFYLHEDESDDFFYISSASISENFKWT